MKTFIKTLLKMAERDFISPQQFIDLSEKLNKDKSYLAWRKATENKIDVIFTQGFSKIDFNWRDIKSYLFNKDDFKDSDLLKDIDAYLNVDHLNNAENETISEALRRVYHDVDVIFDDVADDLGEDVKTRYADMISQFVLPLQLTSNAIKGNDKFYLNRPPTMSYASRINIVQLNVNYLVAAYLLVRCLHHRKESLYQHYLTMVEIKQEWGSHDNSNIVVRPLALYYHLSDFFTRLLEVEDDVIERILNNPIQGLWLQENFFTVETKEIMLLNTSTFTQSKNLMETIQHGLDKRDSYINHNLALVDVMPDGLRCFKDIKEDTDLSCYLDEVLRFNHGSEEDCRPTILTSSQLEHYRYWPFYIRSAIQVTKEGYTENKMINIIYNRANDTIPDELKSEKSIKHVFERHEKEYVKHSEALMRCEELTQVAAVSAIYFAIKTTRCLLFCLTTREPESDDIRKEFKYIDKEMCKSLTALVNTYTVKQDLNCFIKAFNNVREVYSNRLHQFLTEYPELLDSIDEEFKSSKKEDDFKNTQKRILDFLTRFENSAIKEKAERQKISDLKEWVLNYSEKDMDKLAKDFITELKKSFNEITKETMDTILSIIIESDVESEDGSISHGVVSVKNLEGLVDNFWAYLRDIRDHISSDDYIKACRVIKELREVIRANTSNESLSHLMENVIVPKLEIISEILNIPIEVGKYKMNDEGELVKDSPMAVFNGKGENNSNDNKDNEVEHGVSTDFDLSNWNPDNPRYN